VTPFDIAHALPFALALRIGIAAVTVLATPRRGVALRLALLGSVAASLATGVAAVHVLGGDAAVNGVLFVHHASGFSLGYSIDGLSAWFLLVLSVVAIPIAIFSLGYLGGPHWSRRSAFLGASFNVLMGAVELVFVANDLVTFLFAWELMTLTTAALVVTEHEARASRRAGYLYLVMSHLGTGF
jgi:hydrogenase-4 component B